MRSLVVMFLVTLGMAIGVGPASAGGPTSAILTDSAQGRAAALYYTDSAYDQLRTILDTGTPLGGSNNYDNASSVTVTWLIHDVQPWRTDRVLFASDGTATVETSLLMDSGPGEGTSLRRKLDKPRQLNALLSAVGLRGPAPAAVELPAEHAAAPVAAPAAQRTPVPGVTGTDLRWEWGIGGVLIGLLAAGLIAVLRRVRAAR